MLDSSIFFQFHQWCKIDFFQSCQTCKVCFAGRPILKQVLYDPRIDRFGAYSAIDDQVVEQQWNVWKPVLGSITRHSTQHKSFWYIYVFQQIRNEWMELQMKKENLLVRSGVSHHGGFLRENWRTCKQ